ncbi:Dynein assembly factor 3, axonemal homolog [Sergentomyia squamirostris]
MFWGWSETVNLIDCWKQHRRYQSIPKVFNILLFGACDARHILSILAKNYQLENVRVNIYVVADCMVQIARDLMLLTVALESSDGISIRRKTHLFMDIYGNTHIRPATDDYIKSRIKFLINVTTDEPFCHKNMPLFHLEWLKFRERDQLQAMLSFWADDSIPFDVKALWDRRLRESLGVRYDYRSGVFDWELQQNLRIRGAHQICSQEFSHWRECGVGFIFPEYEQSVPNKTLGIQAFPSQTWVYLGDITGGPFISYGLTCANEKMLKSQHGVNECRATDVTERNLYEIFYEMEEKQAFNSSDVEFNHFGGVTLDPGTILPTCGVNRSTQVAESRNPLLEFKNVHIIFLSSSVYEQVLAKPENKNKFSAIFVDHTFFPNLSGKFITNLHQDGVILFETKRFTTVRNDVVINFTGEIRDFCQQHNLKSVDSTSINKQYSFLSFEKN